MYIDPSPIPPLPNLPWCIPQEADTFKHVFCSLPIHKWQYRTRNCRKYGLTWNCWKWLTAPAKVEWEKIWALNWSQPGQLSSYCQWFHNFPHKTLTLFVLENWWFPLISGHFLHFRRLGTLLVTSGFRYNDEKSGVHSPANFGMWIGSVPLQIAAQSDI